MAVLPKATVTVDDEAGAPGSGADLVTVFGVCSTFADGVPRLYNSASALMAKHGYCDAAEYVNEHVRSTNKPCLFVPMPIATAGTVGRINTTGNTNTCVVTVTGTPMVEMDIVLKVKTGGTIGTDVIVLSLSCDGDEAAGGTLKTVTLGQANSYAIPYSGITLNFAAGDLTTGQTILTCHTTAPICDATGLETGRLGLTAQQRQSRSWILIGDVPSNSAADDLVTEVNAYATVAHRFEVARASVRDRLPLAEMSHTSVHMTGSPTVTFTEVGAGNDTAVRGSGSFIADGFTTGDTIIITGAVVGSGHNNITGVATVTNATTLTFPAAAADLDNEGPISGVSMTATPTLTFGDNGGSPDTLTRNSGSWINDGFRVGDSITITGTASNNVTKTLTDVSATVLTVATGSFAAEVIGVTGVTVTAGETKTDWKAAIDAMFADIDDEKRVSLGCGRARTNGASIGGWKFRRPSSWKDSITSFDGKHDIGIPTWRTADGPTGWSLWDAAGNLVEWDQHVDAGDDAETRFTCFRTWPNLNGAYLGISLTRALDASLLSRTHYMEVANLACQVCDAATTLAIGQSLVLKADGKTATSESLNKIKSKVEQSLRRELLQDKGQGEARAASVSWDPATDDDLSAPGATLTGVLTLGIKRSIERIATSVKVV